jgi:hypothetical protein
VYCFGITMILGSLIHFFPLIRKKKFDFRFLGCGNLFRRAAPLLPLLFIGRYLFLT